MCDARTAGRCGAGSPSSNIRATPAVTTARERRGLADSRQNRSCMVWQRAAHNGQVSPFRRDRAGGFSPPPSPLGVAPRARPRPCLRSYANHPRPLGERAACGVNTLECRFNRHRKQNAVPMLPHRCSHAGLVRPSWRAKADAQLPRIVGRWMVAGTSIYCMHQWLTWVLRRICSGGN